MANRGKKHARVESKHKGCGNFGAGRTGVAKKKIAKRKGN